MRSRREQAIKPEQLEEVLEERYIAEKIYRVPSVWEQAERAQKTCNLGLNIIKTLGDRCKGKAFDLFHLSVSWNGKEWRGIDPRHVIASPLGGQKGFLDEGELVNELARRCLCAVQGSFRVLVTGKALREDEQQDLCYRTLLFLRFILSGGVFVYHADQPPTVYAVNNPTAWLIKMTHNLMTDTVNPQRSHHKPKVEEDAETKRIRVQPKWRRKLDADL